MRKKIIRIYQQIKIKPFITVTVSIFVLITIPVLTVNFWNKDDSHKNTFAAQPTPNIVLPAIFKDQTGSVVLDIQIAKDQPDYGNFDIYIPQIGYYRGNISLAISGNSPIIHPQGTVVATFYPLNNPNTSTTNVKFEGEINSEKKSATINLWIDNKHYLLTTTQGDPAEATKTAEKLLENTVSQNWPAVYLQLSNDIETTTTQNEFIQTMSDNTNSPTIIAAQLNGPGYIKIIAGNTYFIQPVKLSIKNTNGTIAAAHETDFYILENGVWKLISTTTPVSP